MPKGTKVDLPGTLERSPKKAQRTYAETLTAAHETYGGDEERAHRTAFAAVKHSFEKVGDHWEKKDGGKKGPSDAQDAGGKNTNRKTAGGVDANATKTHLLSLAKRLGVSGRSTMKKKELVDAIQKANDKKTADARKK